MRGAWLTQGAEVSAYDLRTVCVSYSLLHISDLHRADSDPLDNDALMSALLADRDRFAMEDPLVPEPDAIVVSGDLVQGTSVGTAGHDAILEEQYAAATDLLGRLADEFLNGDRARLVVVPGNHDVDWNRSLAAMKLIDPSDVPDSLSRLLRGATGEWRWSWPELRAYRVVDRALYDTRLSRFEDMMASFYSGVDIVQTESYRVHNLMEGRRAIVKCCGFGGEG